MRDDAFMIIEGKMINGIFQLNPFSSNSIIKRVKTHATE